MLYTVIRILVIALSCTLGGLRMMHLLQLRGYQTPELDRVLKTNAIQLAWINLPIAAGATAVNWYMPVLFSMFMPQTAAREALCNWLMLPLFALASVVVYFEKNLFPARREFALSQRMGRLMGLSFVINALAATLLHVLSLSPYLAFAACDYAVLLAAYALEPVEKRVNAGYYRAARLKLAEHKKLIRIGIAGSYGKTETKLILKTLLSEKYRVLCTPPSFNSAMGAARVINEQLNKKHQVFIAELGGQRKGEVREIARVVRPKYGVLTCVGEAHLDSYGSLEAAAQGQYELMQNLSAEGVAFYGEDGGFGNRLYALCPLEKYRASLEGDPENYMRALQLSVGARGSDFDLVCADGERIRVHTRLLGSFAARDIALAAAVARKLGLSMEQIAAGVEKLKPIRGRLQLIPGEINVIDDSRNELLSGAMEALRVLNEFPGRRIVVTRAFESPDGGLSDYQLGDQITRCADYAILIGAEGTKELQAAIGKSASFPASSLRVVRDAADAVTLVEEIAEAGDSVLWEGVEPPEDEEE